MKTLSVKYIIVFFILSFFSCFVKAQKYSMEVLSKMAQSLSHTLAIQNDVDAGVYYDAGRYNGKTLIVAHNMQGEITHIGYKLFPAELKIHYPSEIYDFLERYFLELSLIEDGFTRKQRIEDDKFLFLKGEFASIAQINDETPFSINRTENSCYSVTWSIDGKEILSVQFPIQFELLLGMPKSEIERNVMMYVRESKSFDSVEDVPQLERLEDGYYRTLPIAYYYAESMLSTKYYQKSDEKMEIVFSPKEKWYSAANLFLSEIAKSMSYKIFVEQSLYGKETAKYTISLSSWLNYCKQNKLKLFFSVEEEREDGLKALLIAQSADLGYNHMMSIILPDNFVTKQDAVIKAKLNAFIPTQNVRSLYSTYTSKPKKKI